MKKPNFMLNKSIIHCIVPRLTPTNEKQQCRVLLNLRTSQPFEEVVEDLGQVLKMTGAKRMYTSSGQEVRSFSQLRNEFADMETFYLGIGSSVVAPMALPTGSPVRRSRSRGSLAAPLIQDEPVKTAVRQRARSKSRPRILYAPENEIVERRGGGGGGDYTLIDEPTKLIIRGLRRTFYPPLHHAPMDNSPPDRKLLLHWVHGYRGTDSRKNLWVLPSGELLYFVAAVAVLYDRDEDSQRHYTGHTEDIMWYLLRLRVVYGMWCWFIEILFFLNLQYGCTSVARVGCFRTAWRTR